MKKIIVDCGIIRKYGSSKFMIRRDNLEDGKFWSKHEKYTHHLKANGYPISHGMPLSEKLKPMQQFFNKSIKSLVDELVESKDENVLQLSSDAQCFLMQSSDAVILQGMYSLADYVVERLFNNVVYLRGIVEFGNVCEKDCKYCGLRKGMGSSVKRYEMKPEEIVQLGVECYENMYGTYMLQAGEISSEKRIDLLCDCIRQIVKKTDGKLCVALSVGELEESQYKKLYDAGARRYLLRIESSNPVLYSKMHPNDPLHSWETRNECLKRLKRVGFFAGTGVLINVPGQKVEDLVNDVAYFKKMDVDMIGMGPYLIQKDTPMAKDWLKENGEMTEEEKSAYNMKLMHASLNMLALSRIQVPLTNISATTALQLAHPDARKIGLLSGANVVMPILTPTVYRENYKLYERKATVDHITQRDDLFRQVKSVGKTLNLTGSWGDPITRGNRKPIF